MAISSILGSGVYYHNNQAMKKLRKEKGVKMKLKELKIGIKVLGVLSIVLLFLVSGILLVYATEKPLPPNVRLTNAAWKAFNGGDYREAIKTAEKCIEEFGPSALTGKGGQEELEKNKTPLPPVGHGTRRYKKGDS